MWWQKIWESDVLCINFFFSFDNFWKCDTQKNCSFQNTMKLIVAISSTFILCMMFRCSDSASATLCEHFTCDFFSCYHKYFLQVNNGYSGTTEFGECSPGDIFCVYGGRKAGQTVLHFQGVYRIIESVEWQESNAENWCKKLDVNRSGRAYWFDAWINIMKCFGSNNWTNCVSLMPVLCQAIAWNLWASIDCI